MTRQERIDRNTVMLRDLAFDYAANSTPEVLDAIIITAQTIERLQSELDMIDDQPLASGDGWVVANV